MGKARHCEKTALKKGAWIPEEDQKLTAYIRKYGIWNWNEMPKPAGLSRSGKSCRLRWVNYLRPGIKRGNFSKEEEETILMLHEMMGNKWSAIAARLPGRTDNEIKNYWHTRLKKSLEEDSAPRTKSEAVIISNFEANQKNISDINLLIPINAPEASKSEGSRDILMSPQLSTDDFSSSSSTDPAVGIEKNQMIEENIGSSETFGDLQSLWAEPFSVKDWYMVEDSGVTFSDPGSILPISQEYWLQQEEPIYPPGSFNDAGTDFWQQRE